MESCNTFVYSMSDSCMYTFYIGGASKYNESLSKRMISYSKLLMVIV